MSSWEDLSKTLTMVLAGGEGDRLQPLTRHRSKPAVPFGGIYRIIDFTLSNALNSGLTRIWVLTQYKSTSLMRHIQLGWNIFSPARGEYIYTLPPQRRVDRRWYEGTADAVYQNTYLFELEKPARVLVLSGDHVYKMDYRRMIQEHVERKARVTLAVCEIDMKDAARFGVVEVDGGEKVKRFVEKVPDPPCVPGKPDRCLANMGVYLFDADVLQEVVTADHRRKDSSHDFGKDILPGLSGEMSLNTFRFRDPSEGPPVWWDIGTLDSYYQVTMELVSISPSFNLYDKKWPLRSMPRYLPPAKTVFSLSEGEGPDRVGEALDSLVSGGCILSGGKVQRSVLSPGVRVHSYAHVAESILMDEVEVGRSARVRKAIVDKGVRIPEGFQLGFDQDADRRRFTVSPGGVVVVPKGENL